MQAAHAAAETAEINLMILFRVFSPSFWRKSREITSRQKRKSIASRKLDLEELTRSRK